MTMVEQEFTKQRKHRQSRGRGMRSSSTHRRQTFLPASYSSSPHCWAALSIALLGLVWTTQFAAAAFTTVPSLSFPKNNHRTSSSSAFTLPPSYPSIITTTTTTTQLDLKRPSLLGGWSSRFARRGGGGGGGGASQQPSSSTTNSRIVVVTGSKEDEDEDEVTDSRRRRARRRIRELAKKIVLKPIRTATTIAPMPQAIAEVLKDATLNAVDMAVDEVISSRKHTLADPEGKLIDVTALIDEAFLPMEQSLAQVEAQLSFAKQMMQEAKQQSIAAMSAVEAAAIAQAEGAAEAVAAAEKAASRTALAEMYVAAQNTTSKDSFVLSDTELSRMAFEDVDYGTSEMAPPFLNDDQCLLPGEPVVRVEKAPENSRRIYAGIDIPHSVDEVWDLLTDYEHLSDVVPNLVVNDVLDEYNTAFCKDTTVTYVDSNLPEEVQCRDLANQMKGALLRQVGGAKVAGIKFSARTTLEVREFPYGLPDYAHFNDEYWEGKSRKQRAKDYTKTPLTRYRFPRPFVVSDLPHRDISMQSVEDDDGEFRMYQGVWRMQPLPGCSPCGTKACRLTYAVEVSPRAYLPVQLVEGRIVRDLCTNLKSIRDFLKMKDEEKEEAAMSHVAV